MTHSFITSATATISFALSFSFFISTATTEIYTLSLHDALPISELHDSGRLGRSDLLMDSPRRAPIRSEEHTSELQSLTNLVCRLLLEKKNSSTGRDRCASRRSLPRPPHRHRRSGRRIPGATGTQ